MISALFLSAAVRLPVVHHTVHHCCSYYFHGTHRGSILLDLESSAHLSDEDEDAINFLERETARPLSTSLTDTSL